MGKYIRTRNELAGEWHPENKTDIFNAGTNKKWKWICAKLHKWEISLSNRLAGSNCPFCTNQKVCLDNSLATLFPSLIKEWDYEKNDKTPGDFVPGSNTSVWWKCDKGPDHEWLAQIVERTRKNNGCPFCAGKKVSVTNSAAILYPFLLAEWHPTKNKKPLNEYVAQSNEIGIWKCKKGHIWDAPIYTRTNRSNGCPYCTGQKVCIDNCVATLYPWLIDEWHPTKNNFSLYQVTCGSGKKGWWVCLVCNYVWNTFIYARTRKTKNGCPNCRLPTRSVYEIQLAFELLKFFSFDIDDQKIISDNKIFYIDFKLKKQNIIIEYDGSYWHRNSYLKDLSKSIFLRNLGWIVIRIREAPLVKVNDIDLIVPHQCSVKECANLILCHIQDVIKIKIPELDNYLNSKECINKDEADSFIQLLKTRQKLAAH